MDAATLVGWIASLCSMTSFVPQAWKVVRTGDTSGLSRRTYMVTVTGFAFWTLYGFLLGDPPIIVTNTVCLALSGFILALTLTSEERRRWLAAKLGAHPAG